MTSPITNDIHLQSRADYEQKDTFARPTVYKEIEMSEELTIKTSTFSVLDNKPNYNITFHNYGDKQIGALDFNGPAMIFEGDAEGSAKVFFNWIAQSFARRLEDERKAAREACANEIERISVEKYAVVLREHKEAADWLRSNDLIQGSH